MPSKIVWPTIKLPLTQQEAMLIDYVYTMHSWYPELEEELKGLQRFRCRLAPIITKPEGILDITDDELADLLIRVPIIFQIGLTDVGFGLKIKLYRLLNGEDLVNEKIAGNNGDGSPGKDPDQNQTPDEPRNCPEAAARREVFPGTTLSGSNGQGGVTFIPQFYD